MDGGDKKYFDSQRKSAAAQRELDKWNAWYNDPANEKYRETADTLLGNTTTGSFGGGVNTKSTQWKEWSQNISGWNDASKLSIGNLNDTIDRTKLLYSYNQYQAAQAEKARIQGERDSANQRRKEQATASILTGGTGDDELKTKRNSILGVA